MERETRRRPSTNGRADNPSGGKTLEDRISAIEQAIQALKVTDGELRTEIGSMGDRLLRLLEDLYDEVEDVRPAPRDLSDGYAGLVRRIRDAVRGAVPLETTVAVITRGDDELLRFFGRQGWHFPQGADGRWLGYHPKNGLAAIAQLESIRAVGADYLVVPVTSGWWFEKYPDFGRWLTSRYVELPADPEVCRIFSLRHSERPEGNVNVFVRQELAEHGTVEILDLTIDGDLAARLPEAESFRPPVAGAPLPYADRSIPIVAISGDRPQMASEAARVAIRAILDLDKDQVAAVQDRRHPLPTVSVIMPVLDNPSLTAAALNSLVGSLPSGFAGEVIVVDDGSADETQLVLERCSVKNPLVRVLRNPVTLGYLQSIVRGIGTATGSYLLLVNNDMVFLDGWLQPLLRTFEDFPDAGAVGGRLLYPDGRLQEAGGLLFADGSAAKYGYGDADNDRPGYSFVRPVDYCSGCLLLTPRAVFDEVGGVDPSFDPGYYEDTDYCMRIRLSGRRVYYQPESVVVHLEGGTAGVDPDVGMKRYQAVNHRHFVDKWGETLQELQPERPDPCDDAALHELVLRHAPVSRAIG